MNTASKLNNFILIGDTSKLFEVKSVNTKYYVRAVDLDDMCSPCGTADMLPMFCPWPGVS
jgi:hypothetical protein